MFFFLSSPYSLTTLSLCFLCCIFLSFLFVLWLPAYPYKEASFKPQIINNLSFLKILLAYCVVLHHTFIKLGLPNNGHVCVEFFFIISGFMLCYTYNQQRTVSSFVIKKFLQFVPYIFVANIGCLLLDNRIDIEKFLSGILFYANTNLYPNYTYYPPAWYLIVLFWVLLFYFSLIKNLKSGLCYFTIGIISFIFLSLRADIFPIPATNPYMPFLTNGLIRGLAYVGVGCLLSIGYKYQSDHNFLPQTLLFTVVELCLLVALILMFFVPKFFASLNIMLICFIALFKLFLMKKGYISRLFEHKFWFNLSKFSLPIYMTHDIFLSKILELNILENYNIFSKVIIIVVFSTSVGILTYYLIALAKRLHLKLFN